MSKKDHLPLYGVGPMIVFGQILFTVIAILATGRAGFTVPVNAGFKIAFRVIGILLIGYGLYLDISAKYRSKLFQKVQENKLITDGVYGLVRNPVYSGVWLGCTGAVLLANNLILVFVPVVCWIYMTIFLRETEEKWLRNLYAEEYISYCQRVNRCIPWFPRKK